MSLLTILLNLKKKNRGICSTVYFEDPYMLDTLRDIQRAVNSTWPNFSGRDGYPVDGFWRHHWDYFTGRLWNNPKRHEYLVLLVERAAVLELDTIITMAIQHYDGPIMLYDIISNHPDYELLLIMLNCDDCEMERLDLVRLRTKLCKLLPSQV
jgi:hypothetical protein